MESNKLDEKGLRAARDVLERDLRATQRLTVTAENMVAAYLSHTRAAAEKRRAEILALLDNPGPPNEALRAAYREGANTRAAAGTGWRMVPVEATGEMAVAAYEAFDKFGEDAILGPAELNAIYRAMLAASPAPPAISERG